MNATSSLKPVYMLLFWLLTVNVLHAKDLYFTDVSVKDGLSQGVVYCIYQDKQGLMWFGTGDGLNRYNGYEFTVFKNRKDDSASISNNLINCITEAANGQLWVGTGGGLCRYMPETETFTSYFQQNGLPSNYVKSLLIDSRQNLWVGADGGLCRYDVLTDQFISYDLDGLLQNTRIFCILEDHNGEIWLGTRDAGLIRINPKTFQYKQYLNSKENFNSISSNHVYTLYEDSRKQLWVGTWEHGLNLFIPEKDCVNRIVAKKNSTGLNNNQIRCISETRDGMIWIGTFEGLNIYNPREGTFQYCQRHNNENGSLSHNIINCMIYDQAGSTWLGTHGGGINIYNPVLGQFKLIDPKMKINHDYGLIGPMVEFKGKIWIGTEGGGLGCYDMKTENFRYFDMRNPTRETLNSNTIKALCVNRDHLLWIGTYAAGIQIFNLEKQIFEKYYDRSNGIENNIINDVFEDSSGNIWVGSNSTEGIHVKTPSGNRFMVGFEMKVDSKRVDFPWIRAICEPNTDELWFGSIYNGIFIYKDGQTTRHISTANSNLSSDYISVITEDSKNQIWIGTYGGGVNIYYPKINTIKNYTMSDGLLNDNITSIIEDSLSNIWIATMKGLSRFNPADSSFTNYSYQTNSFPIENLNLKAGLYASDGRLYYGGSNGIACFSPQRIIENEYAPPVILTQLLINNKLVRPNDGSKILKQVINKTREITLKYNQANLIITFAALNYIYPLNNQYSFFLDGYDEGWNEAGSLRQATYTNLPSGKYTLRIKACNNNGLWNNKETQLKINILPPPWSTWWAYLFYVLFTIAVFSAVMFYFHTKIHLQNDLRLKQLEKQSMEKTHQMRINLFTNFSHELRTPLTLILDPVKNMVTDPELPPKYLEHLKLVHKNAERILLLVNQIMDFRKQESGNLKMKVGHGDLVKFLKEMVIIFGELTHPKGIKLSLLAKEEKILTWFDPFLLEKVLSNILSNAIKNTHPGGEIKVQAEILQPDQLPVTGLPQAPFYAEISVKDTGKGIPENSLQNIFEPFFQVAEHDAAGVYGTGIGLHITKIIIEKHHGIIWAESPSGEGACFKMILPVNDALFREDEIELAERSYQAEPVTNPDTKELSTSVNTKGFRQKQPLVIVIDDNSDIRSYMKNNLSQDFKVYEAENGETGWQLAQELSPDLIISDIMMPVMDGLELCRKLKNDLHTSHIPVILLTARITILQIKEGLQTGADDYITKPFEAELLKVKANNIILNRKRIKEAFVKNFNVNLPGPITGNPDDIFLTRAYDFVKQNIGNADLSIEQFGEQLQLSRTHLYRKIKALTGMSPSLFISTLRLKVAAELLLDTSLTVSEISYKVGFNNPSYFTSSFKRLYGVAPTDYVSMRKERN